MWVTEAFAFKVGDVELRLHSETPLGREDKGLKERKLVLSLDVRQTLEASLQVRPKVVDDLLFLSRTYRSMVKSEGLMAMLRRMVIVCGIMLRYTDKRFSSKAMLRTRYDLFLMDQRQRIEHNK